jgi:hypothetical protein
VTATVFQDYYVYFGMNSNNIMFFWNDWQFTQQQEVDYLEVEHQHVRGFEIKWNPRK